MMNEDLVYLHYELLERTPTDDQQELKDTFETKKTEFNERFTTMVDRHNELVRVTTKRQDAEYSLMKVIQEAEKHNAQKRFIGDDAEIENPTPSDEEHLLPSPSIYPNVCRSSKKLHGWIFTLEKKDDTQYVTISHELDSNGEMPHVGTYIHRAQDTDGFWKLTVDREIWFMDEYDHKTWHLGHHTDQDTKPDRGGYVEVDYEANEDKYYELHMGIANDGETN